MTNTENSALTYTGERYHPELLDEIRQEHMHRYLWALGLVGGRDVIDLACGEGFGSAMLAGSAHQVIGIDVSDTAVRHAAARYQAQNLSFLCADAASLPLADNCADVVVSFETIEHLHDQAGMMAEIRRVLRPDGFLVMSSPNTDIYSQRQGHINEFHTRELTGQEFESLLKEQFAACRLFGQRLSVASSLLPYRDDAEGVASVFRDGEKVEQSTRAIPETMYYVAVAAADENFLPALQASFLVSASYDVYWKIRDEAARLRVEKGQYAEEGGRLRVEKDRLADETARLRAEIGQLVEQAERLGAEKNSLAAEIERLSAEKDRLVGENRRLTAEQTRSSEENERLAGEIRSQDGLLTFAGGCLDRLGRGHPETGGHAVGQKPSPLFDPDYYLASNPDVAESGMDPLVHYLISGRREGRLPRAPEGVERNPAQTLQMQENPGK